MSGEFTLDQVRLALAADPGAAVRYGGIALAATLALFVARRHRARPGLAAYLSLTRFAALALALFLLHKPELLVQGTRRIPDRLLVLVDDSASMGLPLAPEPPGAPKGKGPTRQSAAFGHLSTFLEAAEGFRITTLRAGDRPAPHRAGDPPRAGLTDLAAAMLPPDGSGQAPDAILLLSDGRVTKGMSAEALAARVPAPVYAWPAGSPLSLSDLALDAIVHDPEVYTGEEVPVRLYLRRRDVAADRAEVTLADGKGTVLDRGVARFEPGSTETALTLRFRPDAPGETVLSAECAPLPGEDLTVNNRRHSVVAVSRRELTALLVSTHPRPDALMLKRLLAARRGVTLRALTLAGGRLIDEADGAPVDPASLDLSQTRLLLLDQPDGRALPKALLDAVATRVRAGAGLLVTGGPRLFAEGGALAALLPCPGPYPYLPGPTPIHLTDAGAAHPVAQLSRAGDLNRLIFGDLPPLLGRAQSGRPRPGTLTLLAAGKDGPPLLALGRAGAGKVALLLADGLHAALLRPALLARSREHAETLLARLFAHLASTDEEKFRLRVARPVLATGEATRLFVDAPGRGPVKIVVRDGAGRVALERTVAVPPGESSARDEFTLEKSGAYTLEATSGRETSSARLFVEPPAEEFRDPNPDREALALLAGRSGGLLLDDATVSQAARLIARKNRTEPVARAVPLYDFPPLFFLLLLLLTVEWGVRKLWRLE